MVSFFLHRLTKLLQDGHTAIEWSEGAIHIYNPKKLETEILPNYYGHSKFTSFLRQLTSYGFHKVPLDTGISSLDCAYKNENTTDDLDSILQLKRKQTSSKTANKRNSFKKAKSVKNSSTPEAEKIDAVVSSNDQEVSPVCNIPTPCPTLSMDNQYGSPASGMGTYHNIEQLPILTVPMATNRKIPNMPMPNIISRSSSIVDPSRCQFVAERNNGMTYNDIIGNAIAVLNPQPLISNDECTANEDLQFDNDFNNVLSSLMVADFSEQRTFHSEFEDVLQVLVNE